MEDRAPVLDERPVLASDADELATPVPELRWGMAFLRGGAALEAGIVLGDPPNQVTTLVDGPVASSIPRVTVSNDVDYLLFARPRGAEQDVWLQRFTSSGAPLGAELLVSDGVGSATPRLALGHPGGAMLLYSQDAAGGSLMARFYYAFGTGMGNPMTVSAPGSVATGYRDGQGNFWIVYQKGAPDGVVRLMSRPLGQTQSGFVVGQESVVATSDGTLDAGPAISMAGSYPALVVWSEVTQPGTVVVRARAAGTASPAGEGNVFDVSPATGAHHLTSAARHAFTYLVTWRTEDGSGRPVVRWRAVDMATMRPLSASSLLLEAREGDLAVDASVRDFGFGTQLQALVHRRTSARGWDVYSAVVPDSVIPK